MVRNRREELYVTVPSLFRCPISMDVMKSPVSLCTGVTYDRTSIQTWLSQGHNTCPATMQILPSTDIIPNLTLRRLINVWLQHQPLSSSPQSSVAVSKSEFIEVVKSLKGEKNSNQLSNLLVKIVEFVKYSEDNRRYFVNLSDAIASVIGILVDCDVVEVCESVVIILDLVVSDTKLIEGLRCPCDQKFLSKLLLILRKGKLSSKIQTVRILEFIAFDADSQRKIAEEQGLLHELYLFTHSETNRFAIEAGLSTLLAVSTTRPVRKELVRFGIVQTVGKILSRADTARVVVEKSLKLLETVATCTEGRGAIGKDEECLTAIVTRLMKCSKTGTEHGVTVLWSVCCLARDAAAREVVGKVNGMTKVLLVMQSGCSGGVRQMCGELVKALRVVNNNCNNNKNYSKSCLASYDTKTTHIMPY